MKDVDQNRLHKAVQNLLSYQLPNGEFKWLPGDQTGSGMATEQALLALLQFKDLGKSIYDWSTESVIEIDKKPNVDSENVVVEKEVTEPPEEQKQVQQETKDDNLKVVVDNEPVKHKNPETVAHYQKQEHLLIVRLQK